jgi:hypothetical protein
VIHGRDRNPVRRKKHVQHHDRHRCAGHRGATERNQAEEHSQAPEVRQEGRRTARAERSNKKAEVTAMMKRAKGATMSGIVEATGWQKHTVRGFVGILSCKGGEKIAPGASCIAALTRA